MEEMGLATGNDEIIEWFGEQSVWVQDATKTFYEYGEFSDNDVKRFAKECIDEAFGKKKTIDLSGLNLLFRDDRKGFSVKSISNVEGVNALASSKELSFGTTGITVIYGENGAGKSGYIRILKKLADAKYKEELKSNVYSKTKEKQSCNIAVVCDGVESNLDCDLSTDGEHAILRDIDIFDTKISAAYINDANEASYEPWIFLLFRELANVASSVKKQIETMKGALDAHEIIVSSELANTTTGKTLSEITIKTTFDDDFFLWQPEDDDELQKKEKEANVDAIKNRITQLTGEIKQTKGVRDYLKKFEEFFSEANIERINNAKHSFEEALKEQEAAEIIFGNDASELDKESLSNSAWKALWKDARNYYETLLKGKGVVKYTVNSGFCPLCGQEVDDKHAHRMKTIDEYINGNISQKVADAKKSYLTLLKKCPQTWDDKQLKLALDACDMDACREDVEQCFDSIKEISDIIHSDEIETVAIERIDIVSVVKEIEKLLLSKEQLKQQKEEKIQDEDHKKLIADIAELKARKYAATIKSEVAERIEYLKVAKNYDNAIKLTSTNKLSTRSKSLGEELLTDDYVRRFNGELKSLTRGSIKASLKQQKVSKGKIPFKIVLEGVADDKASPADVFSEGEKRVVSLAAFFAESSGKTIKCPLVVDDPISSLDQKFESYVIDRLVEAGKKRQVLVFTHRLSMVVGLFDNCKKENVEYAEVELLGRGKNKGVPTESAHNGGKSASKLKKLKDENLARAKKMDENSEEYTEAIHYICQQIRIYVEKSVEDTLLNEVVLRYRKSVTTYNRIAWLSHITEEDCNLIDEMMTKYSYYDHSMSDETPLQEFTVEEIEDDLNRLISWIDDVKKRQKAV